MASQDAGQQVNQVNERPVGQPDPDAPGRPSLDPDREPGYITPPEVDRLVEATLAWRRAVREQEADEKLRAQSEKAVVAPVDEPRELDAPQPSAAGADSIARSTLMAAWARNSSLKAVAPGIDSSMAEVDDLIAPLAAVVDDFRPDVEVVDALPGTFHAGGPEAPFGSGSSVRMKEVAPQRLGICAMLKDGSLVIIAYPGLPLMAESSEIRARNFMHLKILFMKVPALEVLISEDGQNECLRFSFDALPDKVVGEVLARASGRPR